MNTTEVIKKQFVFVRQKQTIREVDTEEFKLSLNIVQEIRVVDRTHFVQGSLQTVVSLTLVPRGCNFLLPLTSVNGQPHFKYVMFLLENQRNEFKLFTGKPKKLT